MRPTFVLAWLATLGTGICLQGCKGPAQEHAYPNDPLLISNRPVEGKPGNSRPSLVAIREPRMPSVPSETLVARPATADRFLAETNTSESPGFGFSGQGGNVVAQHVEKE